MRTVIAVVCDQKGREPHVISGLAAFIRENGVRHLVYKSDQEESTSDMAKKAIKMVGVSGEAHDPELQDQKQMPNQNGCQNAMAGDDNGRPCSEPSPSIINNTCRRNKTETAT